MDLAGNSAALQVEYVISVTSGSLCALVERFVSKPGVAGSLCGKLQNSAASMARGNDTAGDNQFDAFQHEVLAQSGKSMRAAHAAVLVSLADGLRSDAE